MAQHDLSAGEVGDVIGYCSRELSDIPDELLLLLEEHCVKIDVGADGAEDYEDI